MFVVHLALLLLSATAPATGESAEAAREARHEETWVEVTPAAVPTSLPLVGPDGVDADGYPRRHVDRPALRALLLARRFPELTAAVESFQTSFEADAHHERWMEDAIASLGMPHERERKLLDAWVAAAPGSFAPYLARASSWMAQGFVYRASRLARDTSSAEFAAMHEAFAAARRDAEAALAMRPRLVEAHRVLMKIAVAGGPRERAQQAMDAALRICPSCYEIRAEWVGWGLLSRWGGGPDDIKAFVEQRSDPASRMHRRLLGFADFDRSLDALDKTSELAAIDRACSFGDDWRFLRERAAVKRALDDHAGRLADLERAELARPGMPWVVAGRAWAFADAGRWEEAGRDLLYVLRSEPVSKVGTWLFPRVVQGLDVTAWREHLVGRDDVAQRLYVLAAALAPHDPSIAQRLAIVRRTSAAAPPSVRPSAVIDDGLPELAGEVLDERGGAIAGARIFTRLALPPGEPQLPYLRETEVVTDASGRFRVRLPVGRRALVATLPGEPLRAAVATVDLTTTGAAVRMEFAGRGAITGTTVDLKGQPVAGVLVTAIPRMTAGPGQVRPLVTAASGPDGRFTISGVDDGEYEVWASGDGRRGPAPLNGRGLPGKAGADLLVKMSAQRFVRGRVVVPWPSADSPGSIRVASQAFGKHEVSTADGSFMIPALSLWSQVDVAFTVQGRPTVVRRADIREGVTELGTVVVGAGRRIRGHVVDFRGFDVSGAEVLIGKQATVEERIAFTQRDGTFEAIVADGPAMLRVRHARWVMTEREVGAAEAEPEIVMSEGQRLRFRVVDPDGAAIEGIRLVLQGRATGDIRPCLAGATGRCEIPGLTPGDYVLHSYPPEGDPSYLLPPPLSIRVAAGDPVRGIDVVVPRERCRLTVNVIDARGGPMARAVQAFAGTHPFDKLFEGNLAKLPHFQETTFDNLPPGPYTIVGMGIWGRKDCGIAHVDVAPGEQGITLKLEPDGCR